MREGRHETARVLILTAIAAPYRVSSFARLARQPGIDLMVGFLFKGDVKRPWRQVSGPLGFDYQIYGPAGLPALGALRSLFAWRPDVVIAGGIDHPAFVQAFALKRVLGFQLCLWSESTEADIRPGTSSREWTKRALVAIADSVLVPGTAASDYARTLGARRVFVARNAVDNDFFSNGTPRASDGPPVALYVGRFSREKGLNVLLRAWRKVEERSPAELVLVGSGPEEPRLRREAQTHRLERVRWVPFVQQEELRRLYARASLLVLPSWSEPWGFVVNEAMASSLPVVTTDVVGAAPDLVIDGENGWKVKPGDEEAMAERMAALLFDPELQRRMGDASRSRIASFTPDGWAADVVAMIRELAV
jgi:glycosyltransferase involved in cell wall biosynthesis